MQCRDEINNNYSRGLQRTVVIHPVSGQKIRNGVMQVPIFGPETIISVRKQFGNFADGQRLRNSVTLVMEGRWRALIQSGRKY